MIELPAEGGCRCAACRYVVTALPFVAYTCHCKECQKLTASAFLTCMQIPSERLAVSAGRPSSDRRVSEAGNTLVTYFCGDCGSTLYTENSARPRVRTLHVGTLDHAERVDVSAHIWVDRKLPWVKLPDGHRAFARAGDWTQHYANDPSRYGA